VYRHLAGLVRHLIVLDVPVSWGQLIDDLRAWRYRRDQVAKRWLQTYYRTLYDADQQAQRRDATPEEPA
jgi:CRISPR type I-E-associated protein CasB/Cse2